MTTPEKLSCKEASRLLSQAQDRTLSAAEKLRLQAHLTICQVCSNFQRQMDFIRQAWRRHPARKEEEAHEATPPKDS